MEHPESGSVSDLVRYRIETAKSDLQSANILIREGITEEQTIALIMQSIMQYQLLMH